MTTELLAIGGMREATAYELGICKQVADALEQHYPGWMWMVNVTPGGGLAQVRSGYMDPRSGFNIRVIASYSASHLVKDALRAGGELLERANMPRSRFKLDQERAATNRTLHGFLTFQR